MTSPAHAVTVTVLAASTAPCSGKMTWNMATAFLRERLGQRFGSQVRVHYIELFSPESFVFSAVLEGIQQERYQLPVVLVQEDVVSSGAKLNEGLIARYVRERLQEVSR
jgi:disulfide oxidoreductase YuzD